VDVPKSVFRGIFQLPKAIITSPLEFGKGIGDSLGALWHGPQEIYKNLMAGKVWGTMKSARNMVWDTLTKPITRPLGPIIAPFYNTAAEVARAKYQYVLALGSGRKKFVDSFRQLFSGILHGSGQGAVAQKEAQATVP
jgi:hypothetical protein